MGLTLQCTRMLPRIFFTCTTCYGAECTPRGFALFGLEWSYIHVATISGLKSQSHLKKKRTGLSLTGTKTTFLELSFIFKLHTYLWCKEAEPIFFIVCLASQFPSAVGRSSADVMSQPISAFFSLADQFCVRRYNLFGVGGRFLQQSSNHCPSSNRWSTNGRQVLLSVISRSTFRHFEFF